MANERLTENLVRRHLDQFPDGIEVEEQVSSDPTVTKALRSASKHGAGAGRPEFIVRYVEQLDTVLLVECKAKPGEHSSPRFRSGNASTAADLKKYSVDGVLHYARHLSRHRNVIAVAVSGETDARSVVSTFVHLRGAAEAKPLLDLAGLPVVRLRSPGDYLHLVLHDPVVLQKNHEELLTRSRWIHNFLRDYAKVTEAEKPLVISAILLALRHLPFQTSWSVTSDGDLPKETYEALEKSVMKALPDARRRELMLAAYQFLTTHPELAKPTPIKVKWAEHVTASPLAFLLRELRDHVLPFAETYGQVDVIGAFYAEFLRYTGGDGKGLGIVLTPRHLCELFVALAEVGPNDTLIDMNAGTGGFLIAGMVEMDRQVGDDPEAKTRIRQTQLIGVEQQSAMYALCVSNMILRGDGKSNLHRGDCFDPALQSALRKGAGNVVRPNKGLLNPPYSMKGEDQHELDFVKALLDTLAPGGTGVVVVPMSCAIAVHETRRRLLSEHTLVAATSLPDELFYPVGAIACALVFRAGTPHEVTNAPTWFGYWKNDGFVKVKNLGRVDADHRWADIRDSWTADYRGRLQVPGRCISRRVTAEDEWCPEAYLETDYSSITAEDFEAVVREHALFSLTGGTDDFEATDAEADLTEALELPEAVHPVQA